MDRTPNHDGSVVTPALELLAASIRAYDRTFGHTEQKVVCQRCNASWYGHADDPCDWCARSIAAARNLAREQLLDPPHDDGPALEHWGEELREAVRDGIIDKAEAEQVWRQAVQASYAIT
jgi:hypothetical protein